MHIILLLNPTTASEISSHSRSIQTKSKQAKFNVLRKGITCSTRFASVVAQSMALDWKHHRTIIEMTYVNLSQGSLKNMCLLFLQTDRWCGGYSYDVSGR